MYKCNGAEVIHFTDIFPMITLFEDHVCCHALVIGFVDTFICQHSCLASSPLGPSFSCAPRARVVLAVLVSVHRQECNPSRG